VSVALVLLDAGADLESVEAVGSRSPLLAACLVDRPELVALLHARGANVKAMDSDGYNALQMACAKRSFWARNDSTSRSRCLHKDSKGRGTMSRALIQSSAMADTMSKFLPSNYKLKRPYVSETDPIDGCRNKFGFEVKGDDFGDFVEPELNWAMLRDGLPLFLTNLKMMCSTRFQGTAV
jgi:ankyrin repeat protein